MTKHIHIHVGKTKDESEKKGFVVRIDGNSVGNTIASSSSEAIAKARHGLVSVRKSGNNWRVKRKDGGTFDVDLNKGSTPEEVLRNLRVTVSELNGDPKYLHNAFN